jgi:nitrogen regulatory protein P-II 1
LIRVDITIPETDVGAISEGLRKIHVGGVTILKVKGRGKTLPPKIHAGRTDMFRPEFVNGYKLEVIVADNKENEIIEIVRKNSKIGKIFILPVTRAIDIESGVEDERAI